MTSRYRMPTLISKNALFGECCVTAAYKNVVKIKMFNPCTFTEPKMIQKTMFAKAIQSLSKFGSDLFVEADEHGFLLRSINSSKSAVGTFKFKKNFFDLYIVRKDEENYCKLSMKASLVVFRNMKQVEQCELNILPTQSKFQIQLKCRLETVKNALISIVDEENISAAVSLTDSVNVIIGSHRIFNEISSNFNASEEEITLEALQKSLTVKNYIEGSRVNDRFMRSQLKLLPAEFENYKISLETTITFCLKEFKAFLMFAEALNENLSLNFQDGGSPLILKISKFDQIECILIMSTLSPEDVSFFEECEESEVADLSSASSTLKRKHSNSKPKKSRTKSKKSIHDETTQSNDSAVFQFGSSKNNTSQSIDVARDCVDPKNRIPREQNELIVQPCTLNSSLARLTPAARHPESEVFVTFFESEDKPEEECIPQSPQREPEGHLRSIFSRCFESTYIPKEPTPDSQVFVPNSDSD